MHPNKFHPPRSRANQRGVSLLEVLIAVIVLSIGLLGIAGMQTNALRNSQSSLQRSQAVMLTNYIFDAMRANRTEVYSLAKTCEVPASESTLAEWDIKEWLSKMQEAGSLASDACGEISCDDSVCTVNVYWNDSRGTPVDNSDEDECGELDDGWVCLSTMTRL